MTIKPLPRNPAEVITLPYDIISKAEKAIREVAFMPYGVVLKDERPTSNPLKLSGGNIQRRIMMSLRSSNYFKIEQKNQWRSLYDYFCFFSDVHLFPFNIRCWTFDVRCSFFFSPSWAKTT
ncbi:MAG: hypothetical protein KAU60_03510 [Desulfobacterales bacterium]|nr:hypothetical protein [Desulfobacterales bacterium]